MTMASATIYHLLVQYAERGEAGMRTVRIPESGGMPTPHDLVCAFRDTVGQPIYPVWGSTETCGIAFAARPGGDLVPGSVGPPCPYYETRLLDQGREAPPGRTGLLHIRGGGVVDGYMPPAGDDPPRAAATAPGGGFMPDSWFNTGDIMRRDDQDNFFFLGRADGQIKIGGLKVFPEEIRAACLAHDGVRDAVVVARPDALRGQVHAVLVEQVSGTILNAIEFKHFLGKKLARYKIPKYCIFTRSMPRRDGGKVDLREAADTIDRAIGEAAS
ncbi:long-chain fatty acid--CoA ligase, partial [bacterium]|nr:long-chain fatty acid--CoA ligase [candidate division CSSED10-310 bacterium]